MEENYFHGLLRHSATLGSRGTHRVNSVHPGIIDTDIWSKMVTGADAVRRNEPTDIHALSRAFVPLSRAGEAQDIADGVLFLASPASGYMTGAELVIDGGMFGGGMRR